VSARARKAVALETQRVELLADVDKETDEALRRVWLAIYDMDFGDRRVARNYAAGTLVSTIRQPQTYVLAEDPVFETMLCRRGRWGARMTWPNIRLARRRHWYVVRYLRQGLPPVRTYKYRKRR
jgi:hypothetical protein